MVVVLHILTTAMFTTIYIITPEWQLTTEVTAPGFCTLRALTIWKTSTTPSVLHFSMVVAMAQNIPVRPTVSLHGKTNAKII